MNYELINTLSLITAFAGGMVALFAPCCITFLLPSYLANVFKTKNRVVWMTMIFGLGIATILVPTALGIRAIGTLFQAYHTQTYVIGGIVMILLGAMELTGRKITLPMLNLTIDLNKKNDPWSIYILGIFSGITTSCCTPVLAGVLTISFLSPSFFWAGLAGVSYVFGMVAPLVVLALFIEKVNWSTLPSFRTKTIYFGGKRILITDFFAGVLYILVGITFSTLALTGSITMGMPKNIETEIGLGVFGIIRTIRTLPGAEYIFAIVLIGLLYVFLKRRRL